MKNKVLISFAITIILLIILGINSISKMNYLSNISQELYEHPYRVTTAAKTIQSKIIEMQLHMLQLIKSTSSKELIVHSQNLNLLEAEVNNQFNIIFEYYLGDKNDITESYSSFLKWNPLRKKIIKLLNENKLKEASSILYTEQSDYLFILNTKVIKLVKYAHNKARFFNTEAIKNKESSIFFFTITLASIVIFILAMLIILIKNINKTDKKIKKHFHLIDQNIMSIIVNDDFKIISASHALSRHLHMTVDELKLTPAKWLYKECDESTIKEISQIITSGKNWHGEIKVHNLYNETIWLKSDIYPQYNDNFEIIEYSNIFTDITNKKELEEMSKTDGLTGLNNRREFDTVFPIQISIAKRNKELLAFVMLDIDHFKQYNDNYGHQEGDEVIKKVATILKSSLKRPLDYSFRLGGEEFGMIYAVSTYESALHIVQKVKNSLENEKIPHCENSASKYVTLSAGLYIIDTDDISSVEEIYKKTDELLYNSKKNGRNKITVNKNEK